MPKLEFLIGLDERVLGLLELVSHSREPFKAETYWAALVKLAWEKFPCISVAVLLVNKETGHLDIKMYRGLSGGFAKQYKPRADEGIFAELLRGGYPRIINNLTPTSKYYPMLLEHPAKSMLIVPIKLGGEVLGYACMHSLEPSSYSEVDVGIFSAMVDVASLGASLSEADEELTGLAPFDGKTELYTNRFFLRILDDELRRMEYFGRPLALVLFEIANLREIRMTYGVKKAEEVFVKVAQMLKENLRSVDRAAVRMQGEEFIILLAEAEPIVAQNLAQSIQKRIVKAIDREGLQIRFNMGLVSVSSGSQDRGKLLHQLEYALFQAKRLGGEKIYVIEL